MEIKEIHEKVLKALPDAEKRISKQPHSYLNVYWPQSLSTYVQVSPEKPSKLYSDFMEEVLLIQKIIEPNFNSKTVSPENATFEESVNAINVSSVARANALEIWNNIAIRIKKDGPLVFFISAPVDIFLGPVIQVIPVDNYITSLAEKTSLDSSSISHLEQKLGYWKTAAIVLSCIFAIYIAISFR